MHAKVGNTNARWRLPVDWERLAGLEIGQRVEQVAAGPFDHRQCLPGTHDKGAPPPEPDR